MQIVPNGDLKYMRGKREGENKRLPEKTKGTRAKEKTQRRRGEMKGADSAKGENKMHEGDKKKCKGEIKDYGGE